MIIPKQFRNTGYSWGLEYPLLYGKIGGRWLVWNRHTGVVKKEFGSSILDEHEAKEYSMPKNYNKTFNPFELDSTP